VSAKLDYRWRLREVMATRGMFSTTELRPALAERGIELSPSQVYRLVVDKPERLNLRALMALMDILDCSMTELIEPIAAARPRAKASGESAAPTEGGVAQFRPKRARITPDASQ
jgi:DNA-binding Xre family transcriptional regulator